MVGNHHGETIDDGDLYFFGGFTHWQFYGRSRVYKPSRGWKWGDNFVVVIKYEHIGYLWNILLSDIFPSSASTWLCIPVLCHFISKKPADFSWGSMLWATATFGAMFHLCSTWFEVVTCLLAFSQLNSVQTIGLYQEDFPTSFLEHEDLRVHKFKGFPLKMVG